MADLVPHPLVTRVGLDLAEREKGKTALTQAATALVKKAPPIGQTSNYASAAASSDKDDECPKEKNDLAAELANLPAVPDLSLFAGYLGGPVTDKAGEYRLLYLDSRLENWLLIPVKDIVVHQRLDDEHAPSGKRDALWIRGAAMVVRGSGARANEGRFLVGEFTRAADFAAATTGGTFSAATGLLCEATTPGCCWGSRSR
jgi:hypothetical protein